MTNPARHALDPQTQAETIEAILALDWSADIAVHALRIIRDRFGVDDQKAIDLLVEFEDRKLILCRPERPANNMAETGVVAPPMRGRYFRPEELP